MRLVELHDKYGQPVWLNPEQIVYVSRRSTGSKIITTADRLLELDESPQEVLRILGCVDTGTHPGARSTPSNAAPVGFGANTGSTICQGAGE